MPQNEQVRTNFRNFELDLHPKKYTYSFSHYSVLLKTHLDSYPMGKRTKKFTKKIRRKLRIFGKMSKVTQIYMYYHIQYKSFKERERYGRR